jgi:hypothetical protein
MTISMTLHYRKDGYHSTLVLQALALLTSGEMQRHHATHVCGSYKVVTLGMHE